MNALTKEDIEKIWLPLIVYDNTDQKETTRLGMEWEWRTSVEVERKGSVTRAELTDEIEMFKGNENVLIMKQTYAQKFQCSYFFNNYPFDTQV